MQKNPQKRQKHPMHQENIVLTDLLNELSVLLRPAQQSAEKHLAREPKLPLLCITCVPRSGSTLLLQVLASVRGLAYPSNFLTRFAYAPLIGALLEQLLFDPGSDFHQDFADLHKCLGLMEEERGREAFKSDLAKTKGVLAPNEFQHFFRNHMPHTEVNFLTDEELGRIDMPGILLGLASIEHVTRKPFVTKTTLLSQNIPFLARHLPTAIFFYVDRSPQETMLSLFHARCRLFGSAEVWMGRKPSEYFWLKDMDPLTQIAGQVFFMRRNIENGLCDIPEDRKVSISYEQLCLNPAGVVELAAEKCAKQHYPLPLRYHGPPSFTPSKPADQGDIAKGLQDAYAKIAAKFS